MPDITSNNLAKEIQRLGAQVSDALAPSMATTIYPLLEPQLNDTYARMAPKPTGNATADTNALTALANSLAATGGRIRLHEGTYVLNATLPLHPGVAWAGVPPSMRQTERSTGLWLADGPFEYEGGTVLQGDGTFDAFAGNATDITSLPAKLGDTEIPGVDITGIGFDNFRDGIRAGARNTMGLTHGHLDKLWFRRCTGYALRLTNFAHMTYGDLRTCTLPNNGSEGAFYFAVDIPITTFQPGNSRFGELYAYVPPTSPKTRGLRFHAQGDAGGGSMAHLDAQRVQVNRFGTDLIQQTATFTNGSANISVTDGTAYAVGMAVAFTTTVAGFKADLIYRIKTIASNTITLAPDSMSAEQVATAGGTATMRTYGMPNIEWTAREAGSSHVSSNFLNLDSEGVVSVGIYTEKCTLNWFGVGVVTANCLANIVGRSTDLSQWNVREPATVDFDASSASSSYFGARKATRQFPLRGLWYDSTRLANVLAVGNGTDHPTLNKGDLVTRGGGFLYPEWGIGERYFGIDGGVGLYGNEVGNIVFTGTAPITHTLPLLSNDTGAINECRLGAWYEFQNIGTANLTVETAGGQLFNNVSAKTSLTVLPQHALRVTAVKTQNGILTWVAKDVALA